MRTPSMDNNGLKKGAWSPEEDQKLIAYITRYRIWNWNLMPKYAGLARTGKSCRLRWVNYLNPQIERGNITKEEEDIIMNMYTRLGWSAIARRLPGRTDNEIKNYWHTHLKKHFKETLVPKGINDIRSFVVADEESSNESKSKVMTLDSALKASNVESSSGEFSPSVSGSSVEENVVYSLDEMSSVSFKLNRDLQSIWSQSFTNGNLSMRNDEEGWYPEPSSPYGLYDYEYCFGHLLKDDHIEGI